MQDASVPGATPVLPAAQVSCNIMAEGAVAAVGCSRIATNISMSVVDLIMVGWFEHLHTAAGLLPSHLCNRIPVCTHAYGSAL
jgi:phosphate/sulfate permease